MVQSYNDKTELKHFVQIDGSNYTIYVCPKKYEQSSDCNLGKLNEWMNRIIKNIDIIYNIFLVIILLF